MERRDTKKITASIQYELHMHLCKSNAYITYGEKIVYFTLMYATMMEYGFLLLAKCVHIVQITHFSRNQHYLQLSHFERLSISYDKTIIYPLLLLLLLLDIDR